MRAHDSDELLAGYLSGPAAATEATSAALPRAAAARAVVLVEGVSDQIAVETLAARHGRDLAAEGVVVLPAGGVHGISRYLRVFGPEGTGARLAGLCDEAEEHIVRRGLTAAGLGGGGSADAGLYRIVNKASGLLLGVSGESVASGANELVSGDKSTPDQLWQLIPDGDGHDELANYNSGLVLGVTDANTAAGALTIQWPDGQSSGGAGGARVPGKIGKAVHLDGDGEYIALPNGIVSGLTGGYTVSGWVDPAVNSTWSRLFDFGTGTTDYMFLTISDGTNVRFAITTSGPGGEQQINGTGVLPLNTWSLVTVTVSGTTGTLYVNGTPVGTNPDITITPASLGTTTQDWIGRSEYAGDPFLNASVDDFNIYISALTAAQVATLASGGAGAGNVADYTFDETGGTTVIDSSGNGHNGTILSAEPVLNFGDPNLNDHLWTLTAS